MENNNQPSRKRFRSTSDGQETSIATYEVVLSYFQSEYEKKVGEIAILKQQHQELQKHAVQLEKENIQMKESIQNQGANDEVSKKALKDEIDRLEQYIPELEKTNQKQLEMIADLQKQQEFDQHTHADSKKTMEAKIARLEQANADLRATNKKQSEKISVLEKHPKDGSQQQKEVDRPAQTPWWNDDVRI